MKSYQFKSLDGLTVKTMFPLKKDSTISIDEIVSIDGKKFKVINIF